jgi:(1->4)-alpha-D-glucan 1-alpha-D-glucosylmutase
MMKAIKEAKLYTSWINENKAYDEAMARFVEQTLTGVTAPRFLSMFLPFARRVATLGMLNSLSQLVLKIAAPGVPDFYQGTELWSYSLVDPDNRRPVDYDLRRRLLDGIDPLLAAEALLRTDPPASTVPTAAADRPAAVVGLLDAWPDGRIKLYLTAAGLRLRRALRDVFLHGEYVALESDLTVAAGVVAIARTFGGRTVVAIVPRFVSRLLSPARPLPTGAEIWRTSRVFVPPEASSRAYRNLLTGEEVRPVRHDGLEWIFVGDALRTCPVALILGER